MSQKYTDARYPEKINDLIDNEGNVNPEIIPPAPTPEPGLKLYYHDVVFNTENFTTAVKVISTKKEEYSKSDLFYEITEPWDKGFPYNISSGGLCISGGRDITYDHVVYRCKPGYCGNPFSNYIRFFCSYPGGTPRIQLISGGHINLSDGTYEAGEIVIAEDILT